jgi:hypothetical protein
MRKTAVLTIALGFCIVSCQFLDLLAERFAIFLVQFSFKSLGIGIVTPPNLISTSLADYGITLNCTVNARNDNSTRAVFDGATFKMRVNDTSKAARAVESPIPSFAVADSSDTNLVIPFIITLDNPVFSKDVLLKIVNGDAIPYRISADLQFNLIAPRIDGSGTVDTLGSKTMTLDLVTDEVSTRPDLTSFTGQAFLAALNLISFL